MALVAERDYLGEIVIKTQKDVKLNRAVYGVDYSNYIGLLLQLYAKNTSNLENPLESKIIGKLGDAILNETLGCKNLIKQLIEKNNKKVLEQVVNYSKMLMSENSRIRIAGVK